MPSASAPAVDAGAEHQARHDEQRQPGDVVLLRRRQREPAVARFLRPDRDQVLLLRQPADGVHEQVLVALDAEHAVRREVRIAEHDDPGFGLRRVRVSLRRRRRWRRRFDADTAAAIVIGPGLSPLPSSSDTSPDVSSDLMSVSAQLCGLDSTNG